MAAPLKPCGTRAAYQRHLSKNEVPCRRCTEANRIHQQDWVKARERRAVLDEVAAQTIWHGRRSA